MFGQESGIDYCLFLIGVSIQITAYILHPVEDMPGFPFLRPFKNEMLHEVGSVYSLDCIVFYFLIELCYKNTIKLIAVYRKLQIFVDYNSYNVYEKDRNILFCLRKH